MQLLVQPRDGLAPLLKAIHKARKSVEMVIFRFDRPELRHALVEAVRRGVAVRALISYTNRGGEKKLRKLESDFLGNGIQVARTADDLVRYHGKMVLIDGKQLWVLSYNFTGIDLRSRGFAVVTHDADLLADAEKLLEADSSRQPYKPGRSGLVVSPLNSRQELARLIKSAKRELLIWDLKVTDREMLRLLRERADAGVTVRVLGKIKGNKLQVAAFRSLRLHTRTIVCDRRKVFIGSQSLRKDELDARREIGVIVRNHAIAKELVAIFKKDWQANQGKRPIAPALRDKKVAKRVAQQLAKKLPKKLPVKPVVEKVAKVVAKQKGVPQKRIKKVVKEVIKESVKAAALEILEGTAA